MLEVGGSADADHREHPWASAAQTNHSLSAFHLLSTPSTGQNYLHFVCATMDGRPGLIAGTRQSEDVP